MMKYTKAQIELEKYQHELAAYSMLLNSIDMDNINVQDILNFIEQRQEVVLEKIEECRHLLNLGDNEKE